jgi:hypothetical protein
MIRWGDVVNKTDELIELEPGESVELSITMVGDELRLEKLPGDGEVQDDIELPFSSHYWKHDLSVFPTIRRRDQYGDEGDVVAVTVGDYGEREEVGEAKIVAKEQITIIDLPTPFLAFDTNTRIEDPGDTRDEAKASLNSFYENPIDNTGEWLTLYWLRWVDGGGSE